MTATRSGVLAAEVAGAALACAARGWHVFPLRPRDKRPLSGFTDWEAHATTDPARIRAFWERGPAFNVAVACGPSGLVVVDLDTPKPGEAPPPEWDMPGVNEGADVLAVLADRHGEVFPFDTFTVTTRRGGMHLYFTPPPGAELRNTSGRHATGLGWLIDTRANGGYVVAPGSFVALPDGTGAYRVANDAPPAPLPGWLARLLTTAPRPASVLGAPSVAGTVADLPAYVQAALKGEAARVADAVTGGRNHALNKAAYNLGRLTGSGALDAETATAVLFEAAAVHFGPTRADVRPGEARATIRSALAAGARNPRTITRGNLA
ncbi:Bifunctional DNA primase/polymerase, N-terminal [Actinomadura meyerae]|uniref:Bifunctional DNA primase/polymerase, N-terminal n=1 Tax=Actinomadura meyerae TaxID=240840 RepID=A0A239C0B3_9ACTN|nr:bifunctional DNA primase/polymerase [Actinomadura meyerae]SNS13332.1 Bifunctional DNA primase/polymerase, N-terminal [Actinomadura meyerae]